jgi:hypothetical protein
MDGSKTTPNLQHVETVALPTGFAPSQRLFWLYQEATDLLAKYGFTKVVIKKFEGQCRDQSFEERVELEAAVMLAAGAKGMKGVFKKAKSTLAKDLGQKGRARYLANLDTTVLSQFPTLSDKQQDAVYAAWSGLA